MWTSILYLILYLFYSLVIKFFVIPILLSSFEKYPNELGAPTPLFTSPNLGSMFLRTVVFVAISLFVYYRSNYMFYFFDILYYEWYAPLILCLLTGFVFCFFPVFCCSSGIYGLVSVHLGALILIGLIIQVVIIWITIVLLLIIALSVSYVIPVCTIFSVWYFLLNYFKTGFGVEVAAVFTILFVAALLLTRKSLFLFLNAAWNTLEKKIEEFKKFGLDKTWVKYSLNVFFKINHFSERLGLTIGEDFKFARF